MYTIPGGFGGQGSPKLPFQDLIPRFRSGPSGGFGGRPLPPAPTCIKAALRAANRYIPKKYGPDQNQHRHSLSTHQRTKPQKVKYRYYLWTGLYMLETHERIAFHIVVGPIVLAFCLYVGVFARGVAEGWKAATAVN